MRLSNFLWLSGLLGMATFIPSTTSAQEPAVAFLDALRERGYFELADDYLEECRTNPLVAEPFRQRIPLERAENLIQSTTQSRNVGVWIERLEQAEIVLNEFMQSGASDDLKASAVETLASLRFRQGASYLLQGESDRLTQQEKDAIFTKAREAFTESISSFETARDRLRAKIVADTERAKSDLQVLDELKQTQDLYTQVRLRMPMVKEYLADTYPEGNAERTRLLTEAAKEFSELWDKYHDWSAGVDACLYAGRCFGKLGQSKEALSKLRELLELEDTAGNQKIRIAAASAAIDVWQKMNPLPFDEVIFFLEPMTANLTSSQQREETWAPIQLALARAHHEKALDTETKGGDMSDVRRHHRLAAVLAKRIARGSGALRQSARDLLLSWNIDVDAADEEVVEANNFLDAKVQSLELIPELEDRYAQLVDLKNSLLTAEPDKRNAIESEVEKARTQVAEVAGRTLERLNRTMRFPHDDVDIEEVNHVRYLQAFAHFAQENYYQTATLGSFAFERLSAIEWSRQTAGLAMKAYAALYEQLTATKQDSEFELRQLKDLAEKILNRWPATSEANLAAATLARLAMMNNDVAAAEKYSAMMTSTGNARAGIQLRLAQQKWREYKDLKKSLTPEQLSAQADALQAEARQIIGEFEEGLKNADPNTVNYDAVFTALLLSNAWLEVGESTKAVEQLENAPIAPLDLVKQHSPVIFDSPNAEPFLRETYRTAINAYLASMRSGQDPQTWIAKTQAALQALRDHLQQTAPDSAAAQMTAIYGMVASELKEQFAGIKNVDEKSNLAANIGSFLDTMAQSSNDGPVLTWVGQTLVDIASSLDATGQAATAADDLYNRAASILAKAETSDLSSLPNGDLERIRIRRAKALAWAGAGKYEAAIDEIGQLIQERNAFELQLDGARLLLEWGIATGSKTQLAEAMMGGGPKIRDANTKRETPVIWGWRKLVGATRSEEKLIAYYHEANIGLITSQIEYSGVANEPKALEAASRELENARSRFPDLGGANFKSRYEALETRLKSH